MQAQAAELSGYAGKFRCFLARRILKTICFDSFILKHGSRLLIWYEKSFTPWTGR
jgi:hypothetical protein